MSIANKVDELYANMLVSLSNRMYRKKLKKVSQRFMTLAKLCDVVGLDTEQFDSEVKARLNNTVSEICRFGNIFTKDSVCVQLYGDSDDIMHRAIKRGALVCITDHKIDGIPCIVVENTAATFADMCRVHRDKYAIKTTVISGSIGKTTTKQMVEAVYKKSINIMCDSGNDNRLDNIGCFCQHIPDGVEHLIAECSEGTPGMLTQMSKVLHPDIAIISAIDKSHILHYGSEEGILNEIRSITDCLSENGLCITSLDDENTANLIKDKRVAYVSVKSREADYFADNISVSESGLSFDIVEKSTGKSYTVKLKKVFGKHNVYPAMCAFAAGVELGIAYDKIIDGLVSYKSSGIRQNVYKSRGVTIYADCYNAVAKSVRSAIEGACNIPVKGKRIAVLGDIAEAGDYSESTHLEIADIVNKSDFKVFLAFGPQICDAVGKTTFREDLTVIPCHTRKELNKAIKKYAKRGDLVLFKSSHSGHLSRSIKAAFPFAYLLQEMKRLPLRIKWHLKLVTH